MDDRQRSQLLTLCRCTARSIKALLHQHNAQQCSLSKSAARTTFPTSRLHHNLAASAHRTVRHGRIDDDLREGSDSGHGTVPDYVSTFVRDCACRFAVASHAWVAGAVRLPPARIGHALELDRCVQQSQHGRCVMVLGGERAGAASLSPPTFAARRSRRLS